MTAPLDPQDLVSVLQPVVEDAELYLEDVKVQAAGKNTIVRVTVDSLDVTAPAVSLDAISDVSRAISDALDTIKNLNDAYTLEVSSPGTSRPLTTPRHFARAVGRLIKVSVREGEDFTQRLLSVEGDNLLFDAVGVISLANVRKAKVEVELKRAEEVRDEDFIEIESVENADASGVEE